MIRSFLVWGIFCILLLSCNKRPDIIIEGSVKDGAKKTIYLDRLDINKALVLDSLKISNNNTFHFKIFADQPDLYVLRNSNGQIINLLLFPNEKVNIQANYTEFDKNYIVTGSGESENVRQLVDKLTDTRIRLQKLEKEFKSYTSINSGQASIYLSQQEEILKDQRDFSIKFIIEHLNSLSSIYALYQKIDPDQLILNSTLDIQYMKLAADSLSRKYPDVPLVKSFVQDARRVERRYYTLLGIQKKMSESNTALPDIELPDPNGNFLKLSSLRGKTVLLYFWSPLSDSCNKQNKDLLNTYSLYRNKGFEIFAVAMIPDITTWNNSIILDRLNWKNVIEQNIDDSPIIWSYNLSGIPANFLINKDGEIMARNLFGPELKIWLDNILQ